MMEGPNEPVSNPFLKPSKFFSVDSSTSAKSILRPSVLTATAEKLRTDKPTSVETPNPFATMTRSSAASGPLATSAHSLATNPFLKVSSSVTDDLEEDRGGPVRASSGPTDASSNSATPSGTLAAAAEANMREVSSFTSSNGAQVKLGSNAALPSGGLGSGAVGFIFGKNISERVVQAKEQPEQVPTSTETEEATATATVTATATPTPTATATAETQVASSSTDNVPVPASEKEEEAEESTSASADEDRRLPPLDDDSQSSLSKSASSDQADKSAPTFRDIAAARADAVPISKSPVSASLVDSKKSLSESAQEYQARQARPEFDEVEVLTGEEGESNVLHLICRAFLYDRENNKWVERGRGFLRVNDTAVGPEEDHTDSATPVASSGSFSSADGNRFRSRVIFRLQGSLKVVVNTPVWSGMRVEQGDEKRIRLTAQMPDGVRILLFQLNSSNEAHHLHSALNSRILQLRQQEGEEQLQHQQTQDGKRADDDLDTPLPRPSSDLGRSLKRRRRRQHRQQQSRLRDSMSDDGDENEEVSDASRSATDSEEEKDTKAEESDEERLEKRPRLTERCSEADTGSNGEVQ